jgi:hypothetical protein
MIARDSQLVIDHSMKIQRDVTDGSALFSVFSPAGITVGAHEGVTMSVHMEI